MPFPLVAILIAIASFAAQALTAIFRPKLNDKPQEDWDVQTATEGRVIPVVWGTDLMSAPNIVWWGDQREVRRNNIWRYFCGVAWGIAHGAPAVKSIRVNDRVVWTGTLTDGQVIFIDKSAWYGQAGGGLVWELEYHQGSGTTTPSAYLDARVPGYPDHRRYAYLVSRGPSAWTSSSNWKGFVGNSPSLPSVAFELQRCPQAASTPASSISPHTLTPNTTVASTGAGTTETSDHWRIFYNALPGGWNDTDKYAWIRKPDPDASGQQRFFCTDGSPHLGLPHRPSLIRMDLWLSEPPEYFVYIEIYGRNTPTPIYHIIPNSTYTYGDWVTYDVPLTPGYWTAGNYFGPAATQAQIDAAATDMISFVVWANFIAESPTSEIRLREVYFDPQQSTPSGGGCIGADANPVWMLYEAMTNQVWGAGVDPSDPYEGIDVASFDAAAQAVAAEGLGASYILQESMSLSDFAKMICEHIDAVLYREPATGLWTLRLIRDDYDPASLPIVSGQNVISVDEFGADTRSRQRDVVRVKFRDRGKNYKASVATWRDPALRQLQGYSSSVELEYPMVRDPGVAQRIAEREALVYAYPLRRLRVTCTREVAFLRPGMPFRFAWPPYGVDVVFRATDVSLGSPDDGRVVIEAVEDRFAMRAAVALPPGDGSTPGGPPPDAPLPDVDLADARVDTLPWYFVTEPSPGHRFSCMAIAGNAAHTAYAADGRRQPDSYLTLQSNRALAIRTTTVTALDGYEPDQHDLLVVTSTPAWAALAAKSDAELRAGAYLAYLGDELVQFSGVTPVSGGLRLNGLRHGLLDTVPHAHAAGTEVWLLADSATFALPVVAGADGTYEFRLRWRSGTTEQEPPQGITRSITTSGTRRHLRPLAPRDVRLNGVYRGLYAAGQFRLEWRRRNPEVETEIIPQTDAGPSQQQPGRVVRVTVYDEWGGVVGIYDDIVADSWDYTEAMMMADFGYIPEFFRVEIAGLQPLGDGSHQVHNMPVEYVI